MLAASRRCARAVSKSARRSRTRTRKLLELALPIPVLLAAHARAADVTSSWTTATAGNWTDTVRWSSASFPNNGNGGFTYAAVINAVGSAYTVTLNTNV